tara:strand:- start:204 stop:464 length:261 start_codon:yes stop_codon:yes gene_type:complete
MGFQLLKNYIKNEKTCYFFNWIHNFIKGIYDDYLKVPKAGVEPARPNEHMALNHACLPVPALGLVRVTWLGLEPRTLSLKGRCSTN